MKISVRERFDAKWTPEPNTGCWLWTGTANHTGYGEFRKRTTEGWRSVPAHRVSWEFHREPIPEGMVMDHMCRVRSCVNPDHLRVVTKRVNCLENNLSPWALNAKKTHCPDGHELEGDNLISGERPNGGPYRTCRLCKQRRARQLYAANADAFCDKAKRRYWAKKARMTKTKVTA